MIMKVVTQGNNGGNNKTMDDMHCNERCNETPLSPLSLPSPLSIIFYAPLLLYCVSPKRIIWRAICNREALFSFSQTSDKV